MRTTFACEGMRRRDRLFGDRSEARPDVRPRSRRRAAHGQRLGRLRGATAPVAISSRSARQASSGTAATATAVWQTRTPLTGAPASVRSAVQALRCPWHVAHLDLDAGRNRRLRRDRHDRRDHEARLNDARSAASRRRVASLPSDDGGGGAGIGSPWRIAAGTASVSHSVERGEARLGDLRGDARAGAARVVGVGGDVVHQPLLEQSQSAKRRTCSPKRPISEPAVTEVSTPSATSVSSICGSR